MPKTLKRLHLKQNLYLQAQNPFLETLMKKKKQKQKTCLELS